MPKICKDAWEHPLEFSKAVAHIDYNITDLILVIPVPHITKHLCKADLSVSDIL